MGTVNYCLRTCLTNKLITLYLYSNTSGQKALEVNTRTQTITSQSTLLVWTALTSRSQIIYFILLLATTVLSHRLESQFLTAARAENVFAKMKIFSNITKDYFKTVGERNEFDGAMTLPLFTQEILGQNVLNPSWNFRNRMMKHIFIIALIIYVILGTNEFLKDATDIIVIGEAYYTFQITLFFSLKYACFIYSRETFRKSYVIAKTSLLDMIKADSIDKSKDLLAKVRIVVRILFAGVLCPVIMYLVYAFWNYVSGTKVTLSRTTSILMPMTTPYYEIGLILHTIYLFEMAITYCVIDLWFATLMFTFCMASDSVLTGLKVKSKGSNETDLEYMDRLNNTLREFYKSHSILME